MTLPASGPISLGVTVNPELGRSSTAQIDMNDIDLRSLYGISTGAIRLGADGYGKTFSNFPYSGTITGPTTGTTYSIRRPLSIFTGPSGGNTYVMLACQDSTANSLQSSTVLIKLSKSGNTHAVSWAKNVGVPFAEGTLSNVPGTDQNVYPKGGNVDYTEPHIVGVDSSDNVYIIYNVSTNLRGIGKLDGAGNVQWGTYVGNSSVTTNVYRGVMTRKSNYIGVMSSGSNLNVANGAPGITNSASNFMIFDPSNGNRLFAATFSSANTTLAITMTTPMWITADQTGYTDNIVGGASYTGSTTIYYNNLTVAGSGACIFCFFPYGTTPANYVTDGYTFKCITQGANGISGYTISDALIVSNSSTVSNSTSHTKQLILLSGVAGTNTTGWDTIVQNFNPYGTYTTSTSAINTTWANTGVGSSNGATVFSMANILPPDVYFTNLPGKFAAPNKISFSKTGSIQLLPIASNTSQSNGVVWFRINASNTADTLNTVNTEVLVSQNTGTNVFSSNGTHRYPPFMSYDPLGNRLSYITETDTTHPKIYVMPIASPDTYHSSGVWDANNKLVSIAPTLAARSSATLYFTNVAAYINSSNGANTNSQIWLKSNTAPGQTTATLSTTDLTSSFSYSGT